ncbi:MAG: hypothetical protein ACJ748_04980 [Flavisolibacter sp.]
MKALWCLFLVIPITSFSQTSSNYFQGHFGLDLPYNTTAAYSARFDGGISFNGSTFIGVGFGLTKFYNIPGVYLPVYGNLSFAWHPDAMIFPFITVQPGYALFKGQEATTRTINKITEGGLTYFAGAGIGFSTQSRVKPVVTFGYSRFNYKVSSGAAYYFSGLSLRVSLLLL